MQTGARLFLYMKKLLLLSAITLGAVSASQAGVCFNIGLGFPVPPVVVATPAPACVAPVYCAPQVYSPPVCDSRSVLIAPPVHAWRYHHDDRPEWRRHERDHRWHGR